jgi:hypothetical protein
VQAGNFGLENSISFASMILPVQTSTCARHLIASALKPFETIANEAVKNG